VTLKEAATIAPFDMIRDYFVRGADQSTMKKIFGEFEYSEPQNERLA